MIDLTLDVEAMVGAASQLWTSSELHVGTICCICIHR